MVDAVIMSGAKYRLDQPPLFTALEGKRDVLFAGCGGGFDVFSAVPLYISLRSHSPETNVHLANLSFTDLDAVKAPCVNDDCMKICADDSVRSKLTKAGSYFPEYQLSAWFKEKLGWDVPIYTFKRSVGAVQLARSYEKLAEELSLSAVVLVDGGTDSLMFGNERGLGTPVEDNTSMAAVLRMCKDRDMTKLLVCLGFGIDHFHGVCHRHFLENVAELSKDGGFLGAFSVTKDMHEGRMLMDAYEWAKTRTQDSIVVSSVVNAMGGHFGDYHSSPRTKGSKLFINPMMCLYWCFQLTVIARHMPHMEQLIATDSRTQVSQVIAKHQGSLKSLRQPEAIPL